MAGLVIIGSGPAGLGAARAFREADGTGEVRLVSADTDLPYDRPPLSKEFLRGETDESDLLLEPASFYAEHDIQTVLARHVETLDLAGRSLGLSGGERLDFDRLVIAGGAEPVSLPVPGGDDTAVMTLRSLAQGRVLRATAADLEAAVVVGGGFIGCETALSLAARGAQVTLITKEDLPQTKRLGPAVAGRIVEWLTAAGVRVVSGVNVTSILRQDGGAGVQTPEHGTLSADVVLVAAGIRPRSQFAGDAGLPLADGRIAVDAQLRTPVDGIFAAGDVALAQNAAAGRPIATEHWDDAQAQGELAGRNAAGAADRWTTVPSFWTELGGRFLQWRGWGDGWDDVRLEDHDGGGFTAWYAREGRTVGVLTHDADDDDARAADLITAGAPLPV